MPITIKLNGTMHSIDVDGDTPLLWVLRDVLGMTGTKSGMRDGAMRCLHCAYQWRTGSVLHYVNHDSIGKSGDHNYRSDRQDGGGRQDPEGPWLDHGEVVQCGYRQSGQIMSAVALLASKQAASGRMSISTTQCP